MMGLGLIIPLLLIGVIAYALGWRPNINQANPPQAGQTPVEILKSRYTRGEISRDEYTQMLHDLSD